MNNSPENVLIDARNLSRSYGKKEGERQQVVLQNFSFKIEKGRSIAITGPSGSGKTTLLNLLGSLDRPDEGEIFFQGRDILQFTGKELDQFRNRSLGFVFQQHRHWDLERENMLEIDIGHLKFQKNINIG